MDTLRGERENHGTRKEKKDTNVSQKWMETREQEEHSDETVKNNSEPTQKTRRMK